ncbi:MAG: hypothetical protein JNM82_10615 [Rhodocyclaceae bacterium]|nr:hypothetical protein [Rhodocyclaceae bacterium]
MTAVCIHPGRTHALFPCAVSATTGRRQGPIRFVATIRHDPRLAGIAAALDARVPGLQPEGPAGVGIRGHDGKLAVDGMQIGKERPQLR